MAERRGRGPVTFLSCVSQHSTSPGFPSGGQRAHKAVVVLSSASPPCRTFSAIGSVISPTRWILCLFSGVSVKKEKASVSHTDLSSETSDESDQREAVSHPRCFRATRVIPPCWMVERCLETCFAHTVHFPRFPVNFKVNYFLFC